MSKMFGRIRRNLHFFVAGLLYYSGFLGLVRFFQNGIRRRSGICILGLHRVLDPEAERRTNSQESIMLRETTFAKMLEFLSRRFCIVSLESFLTDGDTAVDSSKTCCILTFDDGWVDNYRTAYPWLKKYEAPATIFLATGWIGTGEGSWVEELRSLWKDSARRGEVRSALRWASREQDQEEEIEETIEHLKHMPAEQRLRVMSALLKAHGNGNRSQEIDRMMTWHEVEEMNRDGIEFGSHTVTHSLLSFENDEMVDRELQESREVLEEKLHKKVRAFDYPNGDYDDQVKKKVKEAGYECAFTTRGGWHRFGGDPYAIRRIGIHEGNVTGPDGKFSPAMFSLRLTGWR